METLRNRIKYNEQGLVPAILQEQRTGKVLMMAWMNREALDKTIETQEAWFWSRSRRELWHKGGTSGNVQRVLSIGLDCDGDTLLVMVDPQGPACHTGSWSCFENSDAMAPQILEQLYERILDRQKTMPEGAYTTYLFTKGVDKILKKVGEETSEVIIAAKNRDPKELVAETADLVYHMMVLLAEQGVTLGDVAEELNNRYQK